MFMLSVVSDDYTSAPQFRVILSQMHHEKMSGSLWMFHLRNGNEGFVDLYSCIIVDSDCNHEMKRHLLLGRKVMTNLDGVLKSRDITLLTKVFIVKAVVFPVVRYRCKSWVIKNAERWRIDAFELWCWRRLLRVPWTARRSNQSILREISPEYSLGGLMLKLKTPIL